MTKPRFCIAYGSNLHTEQMQIRCPNARIAGVGHLNGWKLLFKGAPGDCYLTIEPCEAGRVPVAVWEVSPADEAELDRYEEFPSLYYKKDIPLTIRALRTDESKMVTAFAYIMHEEQPAGIPDAAYVQTCLQGYRHFGFDPEPLLAACRSCRETATQ